MPWLDRLNDRNARKIAHLLGNRAAEAGQLAQDRLQDFARDAGALAGRTANDFADYGRQHGANLLREQARHYAGVAQGQAHDISSRARRYAHAAGGVAGDLVNHGRREGAMIADAAATQATRAARAVRADPVPVIVGAIGLALFANLLFGRRR
jgi:hypothetical protein